VVAPIRFGRAPRDGRVVTGASPCPKTGAPFPGISARPASVRARTPSR
jgi:hypothetical protein